MFKPEFRQRLESLLSLVLLDQHKLSDAKEAAKPVCAQGGSFADQVAKYALCKP